METDTGLSDASMEMYPGQSTFKSIESLGVGSQDLMEEEVRRLRAEGWRLTASSRKRELRGRPASVSYTTTSFAELVSTAADLRVDLYPINNLTEAHDHVDDAEITGLTIGRRLERAVGHEGLVYVDLRSRSVPKPARRRIRYPVKGKMHGFVVARCARQTVRFTLVPHPPRVIGD